MNRLFFYSLSAALWTALSVPADAAPNRGKGGAQARARAAAPRGPARVAPRSPQMRAPARAMAQRPQINRAPSRPMVQRRLPAVNRPAPNVARRQFTPGQVQARQQAQVRRNLAQRNRVVQQQQFARQRAAQQRLSSRNYINRNDVRRYEVNSRNRSVRNNYSYHNYNRFAGPPANVYRHWDRGRVHSWNNHRYHWHGNSWVLFGGYPGYYHSYYPSYPSTTVTYAPSTYAPAYSGSSLAADVQEALADEGYDPGPVDGVIGSSTRDAIADYQRDHGLAVTGNIDSPLLQSLGID